MPTLGVFLGQITSPELQDQQSIFYDAEPVYETFEGWSEDITSVTNFDGLPDNAKKYINAIENFIEIPITFISVGPERNQNIVINND